MLPQCELVRAMGRGIGLVTVVMLSFGCTSRSTHNAAADGAHPVGTTASMNETAGSGGSSTGTDDGGDAGGSTGNATTAATGGSGGAGGSAGGSGGGQAADAGRWDEAEWDDADRWAP